MLLEKQKIIFDKAGLGFNTLSKQRFLKNIFVRPFEKHTIRCFKYNKLDHKAIDWNLNKFKMLNLEMLELNKFEFQKELFKLTPKDLSQLGYLKRLDYLFVGTLGIPWINKKVIQITDVQCT